MQSNKHYIHQKRRLKYLVDFFNLREKIYLQLFTKRSFRSVITWKKFILDLENKKEKVSNSWRNWTYDPIPKSCCPYHLSYYRKITKMKHHCFHDIFRHALKENDISSRRQWTVGIFIDGLKCKAKQNKEENNMLSLSLSWFGPQTANYLKDKVTQPSYFQTQIKPKTIISTPQSNRKMLGHRTQTIKHQLISKAKHKDIVLGRLSKFLISIQLSFTPC